MIKTKLGKSIIGVSESGDGNMRVFDNLDESEIIKNQEKLKDFIGAEKVARVNISYNREGFTNYFEVTEDNFKDFDFRKLEREIKISDGLITKIKNLGIILPLADCLGIVIVDERQEILGILHAGRHNIEEDGPKKFIEFLESQYGSNPDGLKIYLSPCAREYVIYSLNKKLLDATKAQLLEIGVLGENILDAKIDTAMSPNFPSNSMGDKNTRFAIMARL